jgi:Ankyrin repeats (3 copies)
MTTMTTTTALITRTTMALIPVYHHCRTKKEVDGVVRRFYLLLLLAAIVILTLFVIQDIDVSSCLPIVTAVAAASSAEATTEAHTTPNDNDDNNNNNRPTSTDFFFACSGGKLDVVKSSVKQNPSWVHERTENGETCLHLTGIYGHSDVTKFLLSEGHADPNIRSTYEQGLRMHPLSWNVFGGHYDNIQLLLEYGADVNLDFDSMDGSGAKVTALDVIIALTKNEQGDDRFTRIETLLRSHGAKTMSELRIEKQQQQQDEL